MITNDILSEPAVVERTVEWDGEASLPVAIVSTAADVTGQDVTEMEPLSDSVNPDSLEELFEPTEKSPRMRGSIEFEYAGCLVKVSATGRLEVVPPSAW